MLNRIRQISALGQAIWLDFISRDLLHSGGLKKWIEAGVAGVTSNPSIFHKSISAGTDYDADIRRHAQRGARTVEIYEALAISDIQQAADQLRPVYNETHSRDGYVSLEVSPRLAHDTDGTVAEARRLHAAVDRPNLMIKVPATDAGIPAIQQLIGDGINVNVTLIFAVSMYERVMHAYLAGLRDLRAKGGQLTLVSSVASFFVSRVDTLVDGLLQRRVAEGDEGLERLMGRAAVANAKIAYRRFREIFESPEFADLRAAGARVQRPLWASTSTKNPNYPGTKYIDPLIGPHTVNTVPPQTLDLIETESAPALTIEQDLAAAHETFALLQDAGVEMQAVTSQLLDEGVQAFSDAFDALLKDLETKRQRISAAA